MTAMKNKTKLLTVAFIILGAFICSKFFYQVALIQGESMEPTLHNLQVVLLNKYDRDFKQGDIIAFKSEKLNLILIKRIIACPNDKVIISNNKFVVNDNILTTNEDIEYYGLLEKEIYLKEKEYIVIGDNYSKSIDSRHDDVGIVNESSIIGKVVE